MSESVDWCRNVRALMWDVLRYARMQSISEVEQVIALALSIQYAQACMKKGALENAGVSAAMERLAQVAFECVRTARAAGVGVVSIQGNSNQFNTNEV